MLWNNKIRSFCLTNSTDTILTGSASGCARRYLTIRYENGHLQLKPRVCFCVLVPAFNKDVSLKMHSNSNSNPTLHIHIYATFFYKFHNTFSNYYFMLKSNFAISQNSSSCRIQWNLVFYVDVCTKNLNSLHSTEHWYKCKWCPNSGLLWNRVVFSSRIRTFYCCSKDTLIIRKLTK